MTGRDGQIDVQSVEDGVPLKSRTCQMDLDVRL
jgi:hypothetical protein